MNCRTIRAKLKLTRPQFALALGVNERTIARWEDDDAKRGAQPSGLPAEVLGGISDALELGTSPQKIVDAISIGVRAIMRRALSGKSN